LEDIIKQFRNIKKTFSEEEQQIEQLQRRLEELKDAHIQQIKGLTDKMHLTTFEEEQFRTFLDEPYVLVPTGKQEEWYVAVPKFSRINLGWLDYTTKTFNVFRITKYMDWLGEIPEVIRQKFKFKPKLPLKIFDGILLTGDEHQDQAWDRYRQYLSRREGSQKIRIKQGYEFKLIAKLIDDGILPFMKQPIEKEDLRDPSVSFELRDYQRDARDLFLKTGAVGVFWSYSAGKTFFGMHECAEIKGPKLIVVPTVTLVEQWKDRLEEYTTCSDEVEIVTYHSFHKVQNNEYALAIFDEVHHLPANQFSRFSTIRAKYRIGLSGSPYREDGRTDYIFALSGFPIGLSWDNLIELGIIEKPDIRLYILKEWREKESKLAELLALDKRTLIFCDRIDIGKRLSKRFEVPFVYGETKDRLEVIKSADTVIISRVGDEGLSLPTIERVIEFDFLFGSRRQESQRLGRLFHGKAKGEHVILMTESEYQKYSKRLYSIYEKGFRIEIVR